MKMLSNGLRRNNVHDILKNLLNTEHYTALVDILKHPAYNFNPIFEEVCGSITLEMVKKIVKQVDFEDSVVILSEKCIVNAKLVWNKIKPEDIRILPVSPMANFNFNPFAYKPEIFCSIYENAFKTFSNPKTRPVNFYNWLSAVPKVEKRQYLQCPVPRNLFLSAMNGIIFDVATEQNRIWILEAFDKRIEELLSQDFMETHFWTSVLKVTIGLKSIYHNGGYDDEDRAINLVSDMIKRISNFCFDIDCAKLENDFDLKVLEAVSSLSDLESKKHEHVVSVNDLLDILVESGEDIHPDLLIGLLMCNLSVDEEDINQIIHFIAHKNPHYTTVEILEHVLSSDFSRKWLKVIRSTFSQQVLLENTDNQILRPLNWKFKDLRSQHLPFPHKINLVFISGLLDIPKEPIELFKNIMTGFDQINFNQMTSLTVLSNTNTTSKIVKRVDTLKFLSSALNTFLSLSEFYTITTKHSDGRFSIIPNPFLPIKIIQKIFNLLIHSALMGLRSPFQIDQRFVRYSLESNEIELMKLYFEYSAEFELNFLKISQVYGSQSWHNLNSAEYMSLIFNDYKRLSSLSDYDTTITDISIQTQNWLKKSLLQSSLIIKNVIHKSFSPFYYHFTEIYHILFHK